ncbi:FAD-dependent oxidoreductase [Candidatus Sumerlaeota bacterium]|nr:FAD-dependent oxidoreductase [Candidatus Sumerlaeota bacterium]
MKINKPKHPVVIIGAGIAGLAAAQTLQELGIPHLILERTSVPGGRLASQYGEGWIADHGTQYVEQKDTTILDLIRKVGMEENRVSIQGGILKLNADRTISTPPGGGIDLRRLCIDYGFGAFTDRLAQMRNVRYGTHVSAVRWDNDDKTFWWEKEGKVFWFEDHEGKPIADPVTQKLVLGSGLIIATTPTVASTIANNSPSLALIAPLLSEVHLSANLTAVFKVPHQPGNYYALKGEPGARIKWLAFEDRKAPERIASEFSLLVVTASDEWSAKLLKEDAETALAELWVETRNVLPSLPELPLDQMWKKWSAAVLTSKPLGQPLQRGIASGHWPTNPDYAPFALAGDYIHGHDADDAARSGVEAAYIVASQLPKKRHILGLEIPA